jgi:YD repeat-containing protein
MHLTSITHRKELFELATRWFADCPLKGDGRFLTQVTTYENLISAPVVRELLTGIKQAVHPGPLALVRLRSKDELRDAIVHACKDPNPREAELFHYYRHHPEDFFPGTPSDVILGLREDGSILGMARIKRLRRIAEKCSRRVADRLAGAINERARALAEQRAERYGIPLADLLSSKAEMAQDYDQAEKIVSRTFRDGVLVFKPEDLRIDDGIGLKFVGTTEELESMEEAVRRHPAVVGVEREEHRGRYNDINLLVDLQLPEVGVLVDQARDWDWSRHAGKGLTPEQLKADFPGFVESGKSTFRAEVILTNHLDLVESEFGSCIHEARILDQRAGLTYSGRIASNASFLIEYMLMMALSPTIDVGELPVKMWGRYLPDVYSMAVWKLFGITLGRDQIDHLVPWGITDVDLLQENRP